MRGIHTLVIYYQTVSSSREAIKMSNIPKQTPYALQSKLDQHIFRLINNDEDVTEQMLMDVYTCAQVEERIEEFRTGASNMKFPALRQEEHDSGRLAENMADVCDPRPHELCDCHAIIAGKHAKAAPLRLLLAKLGRRVDDPVNGCWLPHNTAAVKSMPVRLRKAVPHSRIHRNHYFKWLNSRITARTAKDTASLDRLLVETMHRLQSSTFPPEVMLPGDVKHNAF